jgi:hypothetical protein
MAIAHQAEILGASNAAAGNYDTSITPGGTTNGVCVVIAQNAAVTDVVTSVTYGTGAGAVTLTRRRFDTIASEAGGVYIYWAGDSAVFPTGAQVVRIVRTGTTAIRAAISTMTVAAGQQVAFDSEGTGTASTANPSWAMTTTQAVTQCYLGIHSGHNAFTNTPATNWALGPTPGFVDLGTQGIGWAKRTATAATNQLPGWTVAAASWRGSSIAFKEAAPPVAGGLPPRSRRGLQRPPPLRRATFSR